MELASRFTKPSEFIAQLRSQNMGQEAVEALSRMLPKEKAVAWAEQSARMAGDQAGLSLDELKGLEAAKAWSTNPTEQARAAAAEVAGKLPANAPGMWAANAAAFSKSISLPDGVPPLPKVDDLTAHMAAGSVQLSAAKLSPAGLPSFAVAQIPKTPAMPEVPKMPTVENLRQALRKKAEEITAEQKAEATKQLDPFLDRGLELARSLPCWK